MMTSKRTSRSKTERRLRGESRQIIPGRHGESAPSGVSTSLRFSVPLLERIDAIAEAKAITRLRTIERVLAWALDCLEPDRESLARIIRDRRRRPERQGDSLEASKAAVQAAEKG